MKIVHISTSDTGGAGIAALRFHRQMLEMKLDSSFLCLVETSGEEGVFRYPKYYPRFYHRLFSKIGIALTASEKQSRFKANYKKILDAEAFSFPFSDYKLHEHELVRNADLIILHWVSGFLDYPSFFKGIDKTKKIYWYTHDFNPVMGGFHTLFDLQKNKQIPIQKVEEELKKKKQSYISRSGEITYIANSKFSEFTLTKYGIDRSKIITVPLGLPSNELQRIDKEVAKKALGFKKDDFLVLSSSVAVDTPRKGADRLVEFYKSISAKEEDFHLLTIGGTSSSFFNNATNFHQLGKVWNKRFKSIIYSAADILLSASYEETFGQTIIEAFACGTGAIVFNNSALPELIQQDKNGYIVENVTDLSERISFLMENQHLLSSMGDAAYQTYIEKYQSSMQVKKFLELIQ